MTVPEAPWFARSATLFKRRGNRALAVNAARSGSDCRRGIQEMFRVLCDPEWKERRLGQGTEPEHNTEEDTHKKEQTEQQKE